VRFVLGVFLAVCAVAALAGFGGQGAGPVAALVLSLIVAAGGFALRKRGA
jgi:hypothetical protein